MLNLEDERELTRAEMWWLGEPSDGDPEEDLFEHELLKGDKEWQERVCLT